MLMLERPLSHYWTSPLSAEYIRSVVHTQPKLVGMTNKKLVQMVSHWTSVILVMLARLAYWTTVKLVMTSGLGKPRQVMTDGLA